MLAAVPAELVSADATDLAADTADVRMAMAVAATRAAADDDVDALAVELAAVAEEDFAVDPAGPHGTAAAAAADVHEQVHGESFADHALDAAHATEWADAASEAIAADVAAVDDAHSDVEAGFQVAWAQPPPLKARMDAGASDQAALVDEVRPVVVDWHKLDAAAGHATQAFDMQAVVQADKGDYSTADVAYVAADRTGHAKPSAGAAVVDHRG